MLTIQSLPARQGDALWIEWGDPVRRMIIDMGTESIGRNIRSRIQDLPEDERIIELLVVTHVDQDHIGGILTCLAEADPIPGLVIKDVWFNGWDHLHGRTVVSHGLDSMGPAQGERLSHWLRQQTWNKAFNGAPVVRRDDQLGPIVPLEGELILHVHIAAYQVEIAARAAARSTSSATRSSGSRTRAPRTARASVGRSLFFRRSDRRCSG